MVDGLPVELLDETLPDLEFVRKRCPHRAVAVSCFPSTTGPAYFPFVAGCTPGRADIPGIRWFDRTKPTWSRFPHRGLRSYVGPGARRTRTDTRVETIFARHGWAVSSPLAKDVPRGTNVSRDVIWAFARVSHTWDRADRRTARLLGPALRRGREIVFAVFPSVDELGHVYGVAGPRPHAALLEIDRMLERELAGYGGALVVTSDHGLTDTHTHLDLRGLVDGLVGPTLAFPFVARPNPQAVVCESGNAMANVYLRGDRGWRDRPSHDRCRDVARDLVGVRGIDAAAIRGPDPNTVELWTEDGCGELGFANRGLFQRGAPLATSFARATPDEALERTADEPYPDAAFSLTSLFASDRTGDVLLSAQAGYDFRTWREWPEHHASHGGLDRGHTRVPVLSSEPLPPPPLRTLDVFPYMLNLAGIPIEEYPRSDAFLLALGNWKPGVCR